MARWTSTAAQDIKWAGYRFTGAAGTQFTIDDTQVASFTADPGPTIAGLTWISDMLQPTQITGNTNDWNPGVMGGPFTWIGLASNGSYNLSGMVGGSVGQRIWLYNGSNVTTTLLSQSALSAAGNKFLCPNNASLAIRPFGSVQLFYFNGSWLVQGV
jgi:hypothetical protein